MGRGVCVGEEEGRRKGKVVVVLGSAEAREKNSRTEQLAKKRVTRRKRLQANYADDRIELYFVWMLCRTYRASPAG